MEKPPLPRPHAIERARARRPLRELTKDIEGLLDAAVSEPSSAQGSMAISILESAGGIAALGRKAAASGPEKREEVFGLLAQELASRESKSDTDLYLIAVNGTSEDAINAVGELGERGALVELMIVAQKAARLQVSETAYSLVMNSEGFLDMLVRAMDEYRDSGFDGHFRDFLLDPSPREGMGLDSRRDIGFIAHLLRSRDGAAWWEFATDISLVPVIASAASSACGLGRRAEARGMLMAILGADDAVRLAQRLEGRQIADMQELRDALEKDSCGRRLLSTLKEWSVVKDELLSDGYSIMHELLGEELFLFSGEEEGLMLFLPEALRQQMIPKMSEHLDLLLSPLLTESEKERLLGMNESLARVSLNLGLIRAPLPQPFGSAESFEEHINRIFSAWKQMYSDEDIRAFAANKIITVIVQGTAFQNGAQEAAEVLRGIEGSAWVDPKPECVEQAAVLRDVFGRLRQYIAFHSQFGKRHKLDFYQSVRIKAFMDQRRILVADGTGTGKTIVALGAKCALDKEMAKFGKKARVLVLAPSTGTVASWGQEKMNAYASLFGFSGQKVFIVEGRRDLRDFGQKVAESDIVILGYGKLKTPADNEYIRRIMEQDFDAIIIDECHNIKNFTSDRGKCARQIISRFSDKRLLLLSATPLPNAIDDGIRMLLFALNPERHSEADKYVYNNDPDKVMQIWMGERWFRRTLDEVRGEVKRKEKTIEVELSEEEARAYFQCWKETSCMGFKMPRLQRLLTDEEFAARHGIPKLSKLEALDALVKKAVESEGRKVVIWTPWVEGVLSGLVERYADYGSVRIGADDSPDRRFGISETFRNSENLNVMVISKVADEAIDLSCGKKPVLLVRIVPPIKPQEEIQTAGRVDRRTQEGDIEIITMVAKSQKLSRMMQDFAENELAELNLSPPRGFMAQTIDMDVALLLQWKKQITEKIFRAKRLTERDRSIWSIGSLSEARRYLKSSINPTSKSTPPFIRAIYIDHSFRNAGAEKVADAMAGGIGKAYAHFYEKGWKNSHSFHTLLKIKELVSQDAVLSPLGPTRIADFGGGAGYASRVLMNKTTVVDLNRHFIEKGREECKALGIDNTFIYGDMRNTGLPKNSFDTVIASYSMHHLAQAPEQRQAEEAVLEMNRVLRKGGKAYITFPWSAGEDALVRFAKGLERYGFSIMEESGVYVPEFMDGKMGKKILLLVARKDRPCAALANPEGWEDFVIFSESSRLRFAADRKRKEKAKKKEEEKEKVVKKFRKLNVLLF